MCPKARKPKKLCVFADARLSTEPDFIMISSMPMPFFVLKLEMINDPGCPPMPATTPPLYDHHHVATSRTPESRWPIFRGSPTSTETAVIVIYT